jgi:hypothetical protein
LEIRDLVQNTRKIVKLSKQKVKQTLGTKSNEKFYKTFSKARKSTSISAVKILKRCQENLLENLDFFQVSK